MKLRLLFVTILSFLMFSCVAIETKPIFDRQQHEPTEFKKEARPEITFYNKRSPWESSFNPHEVLQYWTKVWMGRTNPSVLIVIMGNPKINWKNIDIRRNNPGEMRPPKGEFSAAVMFLFQAVRGAKPELTNYGYILNGIKHFYRWNNYKDIYERFDNSI